MRINPQNITLYNKTNWLLEIKKYNTVILYDSVDVLGLSKEIINCYHDKRLIVLYINPIKGLFQYSLMDYAEVWTTDFEDSVKYHLKYCGQFVYEHYFKELPRKIKYDLYFVGINKGRFKYIKKLEKKLSNEFGLNTIIRYVSPIKAIFNKSYSGRIPYYQVLLETAQSKMILEYNQKGQDGLTLRCIEALVLRKKIITNNTKIKEFSFYNPSNIYVIQDENLTGLKEFLKTEFCQYSDEIVTKYYFSNLITRLIKNQEQTDRKH